MIAAQTWRGAGGGKQSPRQLCEGEDETSLVLIVSSAQNTAQNLPWSKGHEGRSRAKSKPLFFFFPSLALPAVLMPLLFGLPAWETLTHRCKLLACPSNHEGDKQKPQKRKVVGWSCSSALTGEGDVGRTLPGSIWQRWGHYHPLPCHPQSVLGGSEHTVSPLCSGTNSNHRPSSEWPEFWASWCKDYPGWPSRATKANSYSIAP